MRIWSLLLATVVIALAGTAATAADISRGQLAEIGLPGLKVMSHAQASQVRGRGVIATVNGHSHAIGGVTVLGPYHLSGSSSVSGSTLSVGVLSSAGGSSSVTVLH